MIINRYKVEVEAIKELIKPIVSEYYLSKANKEEILLYDLITLRILAHFNGVRKHTYKYFVEDLKLFPKIRDNKVMRSCYIRF